MWPLKRMNGSLHKKVAFPLSHPLSGGCLARHFSQLFCTTKSTVNSEKLKEWFNHGSATRKVLAIFNELGLGHDLHRARSNRKIRAGKATMRGRVHKTPKSVLLVVKEKAGLAHAARNLPGVDVVAAKDLSAEDLAPGGDVGRLTVFTKDALEALN